MSTRKPEVRTRVLTVSTKCWACLSKVIEAGSRVWYVYFPPRDAWGKESGHEEGPFCSDACVGDCLHEAWESDGGHNH